jgi:hypothetical protein
MAGEYTTPRAAGADEVKPNQLSAPHPKLVHRRKPLAISHPHPKPPNTETIPSKRSPAFPPEIPASLGILPTQLLEPYNCQSAPKRSH